MRILLIDPPFKRFSGLVNYYFPIGLGYITGVLKNAGHEVAIYDVDSVKKFSNVDFSNEYNLMEQYVRMVNEEKHPVWDELRRILSDFSPDIVGITAMTPKIASAISVARITKQASKEVVVVMGGAHPSISPEHVARLEYVDYVVRGEGEETFPLLIEMIERKKGKPRTDPGLEAKLHSLPGISYREDGKVIHNPDAGFRKDLDAIPFPAREALMHIENYSTEDLGVLLTSRGCPFKCTYCYKPWKGKVNFRSVDNVLEEILHVVKNYKTVQFTIKDDTFTTNRRHVEEFCNRLIKEKISINWDCTTRVDRIDEDLLDLMIRAGCNNLKVGVETGSDRVAQDIRRGITKEQVENAAKLFNKHEIFWSGYFMMGLPGETEEDILSTYQFMKEINPFYAGLGVYNAFPGTELFEEGVRMGLVHKEVDVEHFFRTNPKDYYFVDAKKRVASIDPEKLTRVFEFMMQAFHEHNTQLKNMARRGWARRKAYYRDPKLLVGDIKKAVTWVSR